MSEILFISHRIPFPPDRGDKIRSHHVVKRLARIAPVHIATFADDDSDMGEEVELAAMARSYKLVRRSKPLVLAGMQALSTGRPVSLTAFHDAELAAYVEQVLAQHPISTIYVFSGQMGQYVPASFAGRVVIDFVDVDSAKFEAYAAKAGGVVRWIDAREARLLRNEEARLAARADVSLLISAEEAELFRSRLEPAELARADVRVLANGIDSAWFDPAQVEAEPDLGAFAYPRLIFTGQMDYRPNIDAAMRVADRILPLIRQKFPDASFHIVGRRPAAELLERHGVDGVHVWGRVPDMRTWLKASDLAIVPLTIARGVQNKVLEAMAMVLPVVLTPGAATGIGGLHGQQLAIASSDEELAEAAINLLSDARRGRIMGLAARRFVCEEMSWQAALAPLAEIMGWATRTARHAA
jgi:sugar transferase (PEP-CTERM/EpsH1 system associated)